MSLKRWNAKRDANEPQILAALRKAGAEVLVLDVIDALVLYRGRVFLLDIKSATGRPTALQQGLVAAGWPLAFVRDELSALKCIGAIR